MLTLKQVIVTSKDVNLYSLKKCLKIPSFKLGNLLLRNLCHVCKRAYELWSQLVLIY